jgi:CheY-like chemotaxis protein
VGIIDIGLPAMDGYQVARRIREEPHGRGMLLLALSGFDAPGDVIRSVEYGFDHHLVKPIDPDQLTRLLSDPAEGSASV